MVGREWEHRGARHCIYVHILRVFCYEVYDTNTSEVLRRRAVRVAGWKGKSLLSMLKRANMCACLAHWTWGSLCYDRRHEYKLKLKQHLLRKNRHQIPLALHLNDTSQCLAAIRHVLTPGLK